MIIKSNILNSYHEIIKSGNFDEKTLYIFNLKRQILFYFLLPTLHHQFYYVCYVSLKLPFNASRGKREKVHEKKRQKRTQEEEYAAKKVISFTQVLLCPFLLLQFVGNKAKGRISKRVFQENKAHQILRKTNIFYPLIHKRTYAYQGVKDVRFSENLVCFVFLKLPF